MTDTMPTKTIRQPEPEKSQRSHQQVQKDQADQSSPRAQLSETSSTGRCTAPGRKPLFRS